MGEKDDKPTGGTKGRSIRIPDARWEAAVKKAQAEGTTVTDVVNRCLETFLRKKPKGGKGS